MEETCLSETVISMGRMDLTHNVNTETGVHSLSIVVGTKSRSCGQRCRESRFVGKQVHVKFLLD